MKDFTDCMKLKNNSGGVSKLSVVCRCIDRFGKTQGDDLYGSAGKPGRTSLKD
jgi:hypothetical protein